MRLEPTPEGVRMLRILAALEDCGGSWTTVDGEVKMRAPEWLVRDLFPKSVHYATSDDEIERAAWDELHEDEHMQAAIMTAFGRLVDEHPPGEKIEFKPGYGRDA